MERRKPATIPVSLSQFKPDFPFARPRSKKRTLSFPPSRSLRNLWRLLLFQPRFPTHLPTSRAPSSFPFAPHRFPSSLGGSYLIARTRALNATNARAPNENRRLGKLLLSPPPSEAATYRLFKYCLAGPILHSHCGALFDSIFFRSRRSPFQNHTRGRGSTPHGGETHGAAPESNPPKSIAWSTFTSAIVNQESIPVR